jgi:cytidine deaminase
MKDVNAISPEKLCAIALEERKSSYSPYSGFKVGAALLASSGKIYTGCNIENAAYTPTVCAERVAFFKAISEGETEFVAIAIAGGANDSPDGECPPCGVCRQVMMEFCDPDTFKVFLAKSDIEYTPLALKELLPYGFGPGNVK